MASVAALWLSISYIVLLLTQVASILDEEKPILQHSVVKKVNNHPNAKWKAGLNPRFAKATVADFKRLLGSYKDTSDPEGIIVHTHPRDLNLPISFDAREEWPQCSSVRSILGQGHCGSCWAFGAVEALSDRFCIHFNETVKLSENDLLSCCGFECGNGCNGGVPLRAWQYFIRRGVVTTECVPYFDPTGCTHPGCDPLYPTPECVNECKDNMDYESDKHYASNAYRDFAHYISGIYHHISGEYLGGHAVKLIGWGTTDDGVNYWLLANSWNYDWGMNGYFMIARGADECGIEDDVVAGMPASPVNFLTSQ